jgi:hypothetical protein
MKKLIQVAALSAFTFSATNALAVSDTFNATLTVKQAISLNKDKDLDFGDVLTTHTTDIVVAQSDAGAAKFTINGENNAPVTVTINDTDLVHTTDAGKKIAAEFDFNASPTLSGTGAADLLIGGTAKVADAVAASSFIAGTYQAAVNVDVVYQ